MPDSPSLVPPQPGRPLIVHVVVNVECWPFDQPMPRTLLSAPHGRNPLPDIANFSWAEYGLRLGLPRIARVLAERGIVASAAMNAAIIDFYPRCAELVVEQKWEIIGHGVFQRSLVAEPDERAVIERALEMVRKYTGKTPRGWLGPGFGETPETPHILREQGVDHIYDWMFDDIPCWIETRSGKMIAMPYALELNDVTIFAQERHPSPAFLERYRDTVEMLEPELAHSPRILTPGFASQYHGCTPPSEISRGYARHARRPPRYDFHDVKPDCRLVQGSGVNRGVRFLLRRAYELIAGESGTGQAGSLGRAFRMWEQDTCRSPSSDGRVPSICRDLRQ